MKAADVPDQFALAFAASAGAGFVRNIPLASQVGINDGWASLTDGFPPLNFLPIGAGGVPPFGQDMNGILRQATSWNQWQGAGGPVKWDSTLSAAIGGYPAGAIVANAATLMSFWFCLVDDNPTNPDAGGANWLAFSLPSNSQLAKAAFPVIVEFNTPGSTTWTPPAGVFRYRRTVIGGGGGGGTGQPCTPGLGSGGAGGGGGGAAVKASACTPGAAIALTVGAAGVGNAGGGAPTNGTAGGTSSMDSVSATGGGGGDAGAGNIPGTGAGATPGVGSGGDANFQGQRGGSGSNQVTVGSASPATGYGGAGGSAPTNWGGIGHSMSTGSGGNGSGYGAGGSGGGGANGTTSVAGTGGTGAVIVEYVDPNP